jgi:hypothetical protein
VKCATSTCDENIAGRSFPIINASHAPCFGVCGASDLIIGPAGKEVSRCEDNDTLPAFNSAQADLMLAAPGASRR